MHHHKFFNAAALSFALLFLPTANAQAEAELPTVQSANNIAIAQTNAGKLQSYVSHGIYTYLGVDYTTAQRFMPPTPVQPWQGTEERMGMMLAPQNTTPCHIPAKMAM